MLRITGDYLRHLTNLGLNVDVKVNVNYLDWGPTKTQLIIKIGILIPV